MQLAVGDVFLLQCQTCQTPKRKYFVVANLDPLLCFLINSEPTAFQKSRPEIMQTLAPILMSEHASFLKYDSYIGCNELFGEYSAGDISNILQSNPSCYVGKLSGTARLAVAAALKGNKILPAKRLAEIAANWP